MPGHQTVLLLLGMLACSLVTGQQAYRSDTIHFDSDSYSLDDVATASLNELVLSLRSASDSVLIEGHTDGDGDLAYNQSLSMSRAMAVKEWLIENGLQSSGIGVDWKGETNPAASNATADGKYINRRVVVYLYKQIRLAPFKGTVSDSTGKPLSAEVLVRGKDFIDSARTDDEGKFFMSVPDSSVLSAEISSPGHVYETRMFNSARQREMTFRLQPLKAGVVFQLHRFYFVGNQAVFLETSLPELGRLLKFMRDNESIEISIEGHINLPNSPPVKENTSHYVLSVNRAKAVYDHLVTNGIDSTRLQYAGFGNWNMAYPSARTEEKMRLNRRVEIRVMQY